MPDHVALIRGELTRQRIDHALDLAGIAAGDRFRPVRLESAAGHCAYCGQPADLHTAYLEVIGWAKPREQGGTNHVARRVVTGQIACVSCMTRLLNGLSLGQAELLG